MKTRKLSSAYVLAIGIFMLMLANCSYTIGLTQSMYKLLLTSQISYDTGMKVAADLYKQGKMTEAEKEAVIEIGTIYAEAHNQAVKALASYEKTKSDADQVRLTAQIEIATQSLSKLLEMLRPYLEVK